ncbi:LTA synthase family protein [Miniphocaeibacter massiliensis]|uniref:LTA synthase family protein n=1 Tax=Miniphocaeibacter massiliensis TaxID=2041841 RepID=UPI000C1B8B8B|nr:LTA synthase family protein [Miniphocaeibacter massiliensis]
MKKISNILTGILFGLSSLIIMATIYISMNYKRQGLKEIMYHLNKGVETAEPTVVIEGIKTCIIPFIILTLLLLLPIHILKKKKKVSEKKLHRIKIGYAMVLMVFSFSVSFVMLNGDEYVKAVFVESKMIEENYVDASKVDIKFPDKKQNLIIIYSESMENAVLSKEAGGGWNYTIMPELEEYAKNNTNFSDTDKVGGFKQLDGTSWTVAGMTASQTGLPIKGFANNDYKSEKFLEGAYGLGDILQKEGYNMEVIMGSEAEFGGKKQLYQRHGNYKIFDFNYACNTGRYNREDKVWWGYDDSHLFQWSKEEALKLAQEDKPFNLVIETVNTHYRDGYLEEGAPLKYDTQYENVYSHSSSQIGDFIEWAKQQDFYEDTTIVVIGDHLGMQDNFYTNNMVENYERTVYNTIINPRIEAKNNKNRNFSTFDMAPTILASIGAEIEGNKLGLGVNLYSGEKTLLEKYGFDYIDEELKKNSTFYNEKILQEDYDEALGSPVKKK